MVWTLLLSWTLEQLYHSFLRGCQKKLKGLNIWPFTGITSTMAYSTQSTEVAVATKNFLLWDANCGLIARSNPICLGQSLKDWVPETLFHGSIPTSLSLWRKKRRKLRERERKRERMSVSIIFWMQKLSERETNIEVNGFFFVNQGGNESREPSIWMQDTSHGYHWKPGAE